MGKVIEDTIIVNISHPAWVKARAEGLSEYHIMLTAVVLLSDFLEPDKSPQEFISRFLLSWGTSQPQKTANLFVENQLPLYKKKE